MVRNFKTAVTFNLCNYEFHINCNEQMLLIRIDNTYNTWLNKSTLNCDQARNNNKKLPLIKADTKLTAISFRLI